MKSVAYLLAAAVIFAVGGLKIHAEEASLDRVAALCVETERLSHAATAADSLPILYNIFDLTNGTTRNAYLDTLYAVAFRSGDPAAILDVTRHQTVRYGSCDSVLVQLKAAIGYLEDSPDKAETALFLDMHMLHNIIEDFTEAEDGRAHMARLVTDYLSGSSADDHERALQLYALCIYTEKATLTDLLVHYLNQLDHHVEAMNLPNGAVSNMVLTRAAAALARNNHHEGAYELDERMLARMDSMAERYHSHDRPYRSYDSNRYTIYRRMLTSYSCMTDSQLDDIYGRIEALAASNAQISGDLQSNPRARAFYLMGKKRYSEALPLLQAALINPRNADYRGQILEALAEAARRTGSQGVQLAALQELNTLLTAAMQARQHDDFRELTLYSTVNELNRRNDRLQLMVEHERQSDRYIAILYIAGISILLVLLIFLLVQLTRTKHLAKELAAANEKLDSDRRDLLHAQQELTLARDEATAANRLKSDFVATMTHEVAAPINTLVEYARLIVDCIPTEKAKYLQRFAQTIEFNADMILKLVGDTLDSEALEKDGMAIERRPVSLHDLAEIALDTVFPEQRDTRDRKVVFNPSDKPDVLLHTDLHRAAQVLINLLGNADKFTAKGSIVLDYRVLPDSGTVELSVADTGEGVPDGCEELIFERFRKVSQASPGAGLGLFIVRSLLNKLGGKVWLDRSYRGGARFVFTLPLLKKDKK